MGKARIREPPPTIHERFQLDRRYAYGIGLHMVLDVDVIDRTAIEQAITQFREMGETDWQAAKFSAEGTTPCCKRKRYLGGNDGNRQIALTSSSKCYNIT